MTADNNNFICEHKSFKILAISNYYQPWWVQEDESGIKLERNCKILVEKPHINGLGDLRVCSHRRRLHLGVWVVLDCNGLVAFQFAPADEGHISGLGCPGLQRKFRGQEQEDEDSKQRCLETELKLN